MSEVILKPHEKYSHVENVYLNEECIGMVSRHHGTRKWAATWYMIPTRSDSFPFKSKQKAINWLIIQHNNQRKDEE